MEIEEVSGSGGGVLWVHCVVVCGGFVVVVILEKMVLKAVMLMVVEVLCAVGLH